MARSDASAGPIDEAPTSHATEGLDVFLKRVADEIEAAHRLGAALEDRLGTALPAAAWADHGLTEALQSLDHLNQTTAELASIVGRLAVEVADGTPVDAAALTADVTLRDVARRLHGGSPGPQSEANGEVELF